MPRAQDRNAAHHEEAAQRADLPPLSEMGLRASLSRGRGILHDWQVANSFRSGNLSRRRSIRSTSTTSSHLWNSSFWLSVLTVLESFHVEDSLAKLEDAEVVLNFPDCYGSCCPSFHESGAVGPHRQLLSISRSRRQIPRSCGSESVQVQAQTRCNRLASRDAR